METLQQVLPIFIYILLIGLLVIAIIIGIKLIITMNKVERVIDNVENKVNSLNAVFNVIELASGKVSSIYEKMIDVVSGVVDRVFLNKKNRKEEDYE